MGKKVNTYGSALKKEVNKFLEEEGLFTIATLKVARFTPEYIYIELRQLKNCYWEDYQRVIKLIESKCNLGNCVIRDGKYWMLMNSNVIKVNINNYNINVVQAKDK